MLVDALLSLHRAARPAESTPWRCFVLLPRRWVAERSFAWEVRVRQLARDHERLPTVLAELRFIAFACLLLHRVFPCS